MRGALSGSADGGGWVAPEDPDGPDAEDLHVAAGRMGAALPGDLVEVEPLFRTRRGRIEAAVARVVRRSPDPLVGIVSGAGDRVVAREGRWTREIPLAVTKRPRPDDLVAVRVESVRGRLAAVVVRVFGSRGELPAAIAAAIHRHGLRSEFPRAALDEAERVPARVAPAHVAGREDFRAATVLTLDPADARDHDDALSASRLSDGAFELQAHIADVAAWVPAGGPMDLEAARRGRSAYFPSRVLPMLPERLSSGICSLCLDEDRLTRSVVLRVGRDGQVQDARFAAGVIRSRARLAYDEGMVMLGGDAPGEVPEAVRTLGEVARALGTARRARGALDLEMPERELVLDDSGAVADARIVVEHEAHRLVEECMLAANEAVARRLRETPTLHRVHRAPDPAARDRFLDLLATFGERLGAPGEPLRPAHFARLLERIRHRREAPFLRRRLLRSLERAAYDPRPLGHFALALPDYAHFTSPIRRYPDLLAHRALAGAEPPPDLDRLAVRSSRAERSAEAAERLVVDLGIAALLEGRLGEVFPAVVSGLGRFGVGVEVEDFPAAGVVPMDLLAGDDFRFDRRSHSLRGRRTGRRWRIGDRFPAQLVRVERFTGALEFAPAN